MFRKYINNLKFFIAQKNRIRQITILIFLLVLSALMELLGICALATLAILITNQEIPIFLKNFLFIDINQENKYFFYILVIIFFFIKNSYISTVEYIKSSLIGSSYFNFQKNNISAFIKLKYWFYKKKNRSIFNKVINFSPERTIVGLGESMFALVNEFFIFFSILILLSITLSPNIIIGGLIITIIYLFIFFKIKKTSSKIGEKVNKNASKLFSSSEEIFSGFKELKIYKRESKFIEKFTDTVKNYSEALKSSRFIINILKYINETVIITFVIVFLLLFEFYNFTFTSIDFKFATLAVSLIRLYPNLTKIQNTLTQINISLPIAEELKEYILENINQKQTNKSVLEKNGDFENQKFFEICVDNINFSYAEKKILSEVNFTFKTGNTYFIYGPSGGGKTSLIELICGLIEPDAGKIKINNKDYKLFESNLISYVPQELYLINGNMFDNITFFDEVNDMNIKSAIEAAKIVKLPFFENYQESKNMLLTKKAKELSAGQKQRLVLARAFYQNKSIIILDEPTSNLDKKIEEEFLDNILKLSKEKIIIIVSHNLENFEKFENILLLKNNNIKKIEKATLKELKEFL